MTLSIRKKQEERKFLYRFSAQAQSAPEFNAQN